MSKVESAVHIYTWRWHQNKTLIGQRLNLQFTFTLRGGIRMIFNRSKVESALHVYT